ncbi:MAG: AAA family ATPase [Chloroflexota bacterium]
MIASDGSPTMLDAVQRVRVEGFKSLRTVDIQLGAINVLIGANGAGKSNFLSIFRMLNALTERRLQLFVQSQGGGSAMLHYGSKQTPRLAVALEFLSDTGTNRYELELTHVAPDRLIFADERLSFQRRGSRPREYDLLGGHDESRLDEAMRESGPKGSTASFVRFRLVRWRSYHFHDTSDQAAVKQYASTADDRFLFPNAGNLAPFLHAIAWSDADSYEAIREAVRRAFPLFDDFVLDMSRENPQRMLLRWRERGSMAEFGPHQLSDGTLRFICLATLLLQPADHPNRPYTVTIDEPELGLHPYAVNILASLLRLASRHMQIVISTQSAALLSAIGDPAAVVVVDRQDGASVLRRLDPGEVEPWLEEYSLGNVWEKGVLGATP